MKKADYKEFIKRYDKFQRNNLPTPFWDDERQTLEYVYFYKGKSFLNNGESKNELVVNTSLVDALGGITCTGFYYSFTDKHFTTKMENGNFVWKSVIGHNHAHSFEEVVQALYRSPESFNIAKDEEKYYSKQELSYLRRVQKYLLFIGMKDLEDGKVSISRYRNKNHAKYEDARIYQWNDETINNIISGKIDFLTMDWHPEYKGNIRIYKPKEHRALIVDKDNIFRLFIEFTREEVKFYTDIKKLCKMEELNDNDRVIVSYFKILEIFS